jgi:hypothetical protein
MDKQATTTNDSAATRPGIADDLLALGNALTRCPARPLRRAEITVLVDDDLVAAMEEAVDSHDISHAAGIELKSFLLQMKLALRLKK